jgi:hypothetical protein
MRKKGLTEKGGKQYVRPQSTNSKLNRNDLKGKIFRFLFTKFTAGSCVAMPSSVIAAKRVVSTTEKQECLEKTYEIQAITLESSSRAELDAETCSLQYLRNRLRKKILYV